jgi:hypothetical protein
MGMSKALRDEAFRWKLRHSWQIAHDIELVKTLLKEAATDPILSKDPAFHDARFVI